MSVLGNVVSGIFGAGTAAINNLYAEQREKTARAENYMYGERAANNADARTRALYGDLYSPQAQMQQIRDAGISPSIFYGDMAGISGQTGAQGTGASGISPQIFGLDPMTLAQVNLMGAQTENIKADTTNKEQDNVKKQAETKIKQYEENIKSTEMRILFTGLQKDGKNYSLYELANDEYDFSDYLKKVREYGGEFTQQAEINVLRDIYFANKRDNTEIATLANDKVNAIFHEQLAEFMISNDVPSLTGKEAATKLSAKIDANNLNEQQQKAWNKLLKGLEDKAGDKTKTAAILIGLILNNALTNWNPQKFE